MLSLIQYKTPNVHSSNDRNPDFIWSEVKRNLCYDMITTICLISKNF